MTREQEAALLGVMATILLPHVVTPPGCVVDAEMNMAAAVSQAQRLLDLAREKAGAGT